MAQENKPRFSHITVGKSPVDEAVQPDEEVIVIGAVVANDDPETKDLRLTSHTADKALEAQKLDSDSRSAEELFERHEDALDYSDLGGPMPVAQKIVFACCLVGFVVAIVLVIWFWSSQH